MKMKNKDWIIIVLVLLILTMGIGLVWTMQSPKNSTANNSSNNTTTSSSNQGDVQKTANEVTNTQTQVTNTPQTDTQTGDQSEYVTLTCAICGKKFQTLREGPQLAFCDDCVNTPEADKLLQEAGYG